MRIWLILAIAASAVLSGWATDDDEVTYHGHIRPILNAKCVMCHQPNGPTPFPLTSFAEVKPRAELIRWVTLVGTMPPTDAESDFSPVTACPRLTDQDLALIQEWVRTGVKEGKSTGVDFRPISPAWRLSEVNHTLTPERPGTVAVEGAPYRRLFVIDPKLDRDVAITAFDVVPRAPYALRHAYVAILPKDANASAVFSPAGMDVTHLLGAWAPGHPVWRGGPVIDLAPPRVAGLKWQAWARRQAGPTLPKGGKLAVWALYQPSGKPEDAGFELRLKLAEPDAATTVKWVTLGTRDFSIPPADGIQTLRATTTLTQDCELLSIVPECRLYAQQVRVDATPPSGATKRLLLVRTWDRNWVGAYQPGTTVFLPQGTTITAEIDYDNTGHSQGNREARPTTPVKFGTDDKSELFWVHLQLASRVP